MSDPSVRLRTAIQKGNYFIVSRLLRRVPELLDNIDPQNGWTNLHYAAFHDHYQIAELLLGMICERERQGGRKRGDSVSTGGSGAADYTQITSEDEIKLNFDKDTVIHAACQGNALQTLRLLLEYFSVCVDQRGAHGYTPSHVCCIKDHPECLAVLLDNGAYPDLIDDAGNTPLHLAMQYGLLRCLELLVRYNAKDTTVNNEGWTPLDLVYDYDVKRRYEELKRVHEMQQKEGEVSDAESTQSPLSSVPPLPLPTPLPMPVKRHRKTPEEPGSFISMRQRKFSLSSARSVKIEDSRSQSPWNHTASVSMSTSSSSPTTSLHSPDRSSSYRRTRKPPPPDRPSPAASPLYSPARSSMATRTLRSSSLNSELSPTKSMTTPVLPPPPEMPIQHRQRRGSASTVLSNSSARSQLDEFKSKNEDRLKLDLKLGNLILNNSQESLSLASPTRSDIQESNSSRVLFIPISSLRNRRVA